MRAVLRRTVIAIASAAAVVVASASGAAAAPPPPAPAPPIAPASTTTPTAPAPTSATTPPIATTSATSPAQTPAGPDFSIAWKEHPIHESGDTLFWEAATITNTGGSHLELTGAGFDGVAYGGPVGGCSLAPTQSCEISVGDGIIGGDYPKVWTRELFATMRVNGSPEEQITRTQTVTLRMVDDPPPAPFLVAKHEFLGQEPLFCLSANFMRYTAYEPSTVVSLISDTYGNVLDPQNPKLQRVPPWAYCHGTDAWRAVEAPVGAGPINDVFHLTYVDDEGNRGTTDFALSWPGRSTPRPTMTAALTAETATLPETGGTATFRLAVANIGTIPATLEALQTDPLRDLVGEIADPATGTTCDADLIISPGRTLTCRFRSLSPVAGQAGGTHRQAVRLSGDGVMLAAYAQVSFTDVPPDVALTLTPAGRQEVAVGVTGISREPGVVERIEVWGALANSSDRCAPGASLAPGATYRCTVPIRPSRWLPSWLPVVAAVRVRDDEGTTVTRYAWLLPGRTP